MYSKHISFDSSKFAYKPIEVDIPLIPIGSPSASKKPIILHNIFFESGSAQLKNESAVELNSLSSFLVENPTISIEIRGHTDSVGSEENNLRLSEDRANAVVDALKTRGINENRLISKGFGEMSPIADNSTDEGRKQNRRTEFYVLDQ